MELRKIAKNFAISGDYVSAESTGNGHINQTYILNFSEGSITRRYILRKINKFVFKQPELVINNSVKISAHIKRKLLKLGTNDVDRKTMTFYKTHNNSYYYKDKNNDYWCMILFFEDTYTIDYVQTSAESYKSAKAFSYFQKLIIDANPNDYKETIPDFHNIKNRINALDDIVKRNPFGRLNNILHELELINDNRNLVKKYTKLTIHKLPIRLTHNDTKINNVMLDKKTGEGLCVIDLDTVMPGTIINDFGDMVRTSTCMVAEDEQNLSKVKLELDIFEALTKGYLEHLADIISTIELNNLVFGAKLIVYEQAIRFLTDYMLGDRYYSTAYEEHNLIRAKNQLALLKSIIKQEVEMDEIVKKIYSNSLA